jgi:hypothetical protein
MPDPYCEWSPTLHRFTAQAEPATNRCGATTTIYRIARTHRRHRQCLVDQAYVCSRCLPQARPLFPRNCTITPA